MSRVAHALAIAAAVAGCREPRPSPVAPAVEPAIVADPGPALELVPVPADAAAPQVVETVDAATDLFTATATPRQQPATGDLAGWHWDSPAPQGDDLQAFWGDGDTLYAVGGSGTVMHSRDRGRSWQVTYLDRDVALEAVWGSSPDDVYLGGSRTSRSMVGVVLHSSDRGATWQRRDTDHDIGGIWGTGPDDVFLVGTTGLIEHSADRGRTWQTQPAVTTNNLMSIAGDGAAILAVGWGARGELLRRTRDDARWTALERPADENWHSVCLDGRGGAFAAGLTGIARSTDRGQTWMVQHPSDQHFYSIWCGAPGEAVAVGAGGAMTRTIDGGRHWLAITTEPAQDTDLNSIRASSDGALYVVGKSGALLASGDRGKTWRALRDSAPYLLSIWGSSPHDLYAVGWAGALLRGTGDEHWTTVALGTYAQLVSVWGSGPDDVYLAGWFGEIFHSTDRGRTWKHTTVEGTLTQVWGTSRDDVYLIGASGHMYHSGDRGQSWQTIATGTEDHFDAIWGDASGEIDVVGSSGVILQSRDRGKHWRHHRTWEPQAGVSGHELVSIVGNAAGERFAVGYCDGCLVYSRDRGATWEVRATGAMGAPRGLFLDGDEVVALSDYGQLLHLDAHRTAWTVTATPADVGLTATFGDPRERYAVGYGGTILHQLSARAP